METAEEFARRIERQAGDCECVECMRPLIEADRNATRIALLEELTELFVTRMCEVKTLDDVHNVGPLAIRELRAKYDSQPVEPGQESK